MPTVGDLLALVRAPAALSVPGDGVAGAAASGGLGPRMAGLTAASVCFYWAGMAANDWADRAQDAIERPERPIPSGRVSPKLALGVAAGLTAAGLGVATATGGRRALAVAAPLAGAIWAYDAKLKGTSAGPAGMALCRALDVLLGASQGRARGAVAPALVVAAHTYVVTVLSRHEVRGAPRTLAANTMAATAGVAVAAAVPRAHRTVAIPGLLAALYATRFGQAQRAVLRDPAAHNVRAAVGSGITSLPLLQGALTAAHGAPQAGLLVAAAAPVGRWLAKAVSPT